MTLYPVWNPGVASRWKTSFEPLFKDIGSNTIARERDRVLPVDAVRQLTDSGFTSVLVPEEYGGGGASPSENIELLAHLAQYDSNLAHIFRSQVYVVDQWLHTEKSSQRDEVFRGIVNGDLYGSAVSEPLKEGPRRVGTTLTATDDGYVLDGTKFYSTSTIYANKVSVLALRKNAEGHDERTFVTVPTDAEGVARIDDWFGFGQRLTGSGTTIFDGVRVPADSHQSAEPTGHSNALLQLILLAVCDGIVRNIVVDAIDFVARREHGYVTGESALPREDPVVQETVGEIVALSYLVTSVVRQTAMALETSSAAILSGDELAAAEAVAHLDLAVAQAQVVIVENSLTAASKLFDVGGASMLDRNSALDRHWRNLRTLANHNPHRNKAKAVGRKLLLTGH